MLGRLDRRRGWSNSTYLQPESIHCSWWLVVLLCLIAIAIGIVVRMSWITWADQIDAFQWNGQLQPTTQDSFFHGAAIIRHADGGLQGVSEGMPMLNHHGVIHLAGIAVRALGWMTTDQIVLWFPVVLGSLIVIPVVLIGQRLGSAWMGFGAALMAVVAANYYERTMAGYYDHDMLSVTSVGLIVWLLMEVDARCHRGWVLAAALSVFLFPLIYTKGIAIVAAVVGVWIVITLARSRDASTMTALVIMMAALAMSPLSNGNRINAAPWLWSAGLLGVIGVWWYLGRLAPTKRLGQTLFVAGLALAAILFPWDMVWYQLQAYLKLGDVGSLASGPYADISFRSAHKASILEAQHISLDEIAWRIIGASWLAVIALVGMIALCAASFSALALLPLVAVALFSIPGGLRFTTWGTIPAAVGVAYVVFVLLRLLLSNWKRTKWKLGVSTIIGIVVCAAMALPSVLHAYAFKVATIFSQSEIEIFKALEANSSADDLVLGWWDYGTGVWYYADRDVLIHPALVTDDAVAISRILTGSSQREAAALSLALAAANEKGLRPAFHAALDEAGFGAEHDARAAMASLIAAGDEARTLENDVYLYMPLQEVKILTPIATFSRDRLHQESSPPPPLLVGYWSDLRPLGQGWIGSMQGRFAVEAQTGQPGLVGSDGRISPVRLASVTSIDITADGLTRLGRGRGGEVGPWIQVVSGAMKTSTQRPDAANQMHLILMPAAHAMVMVNDAAFKTNAIQMGVLGLIDEQLFEQVHVSPFGRIFRVKHGADQGEGETDP